MPRKTFFSFHWQRDVVRSGVVRNSWVTKGNSEPTFVDKARWETIKKSGDDAIKRWIDGELKGTSVTAVLIGAETATRPWVQYEIEKSLELNKGFIGIKIHKIKNFEGQVDIPGANPFGRVYVTVGNNVRPLSDYVSIYDWVDDDGYNNLADWIEAAVPK